MLEELPLSTALKQGAGHCAALSGRDWLEGKGYVKIGVQMLVNVQQWLGFSHGSGAFVQVASLHRGAGTA